LAARLLCEQPDLFDQPACAAPALRCCVEKSQLFIWNDRILYVTPTHRSGLSSRYTVTIVLRRGQSPLCVSFEDGSIEVCDGIILAPNVLRSLTCADGLISLNLDPHSYEYHWVVRSLRERRYTVLTCADFERVKSRMAQLSDGLLACCDAFKLFADIVTCVIPIKPEGHKLDLRVLQVARRLKAELPNPPALPELAEAVGLSPDRLSHLFAEEMDITIREHLLWAKMRRAAVLLQSGMSLTQVSHDVGFSDAAHLSRTFRHFFGLSPSFLADSRVVLHHTCET
jgi:AraC-like DNA-binding protein